jgi:regulator of protease activity HflC (stomatin/prohibitin superfamily)
MTFGGLGGTGSTPVHGAAAGAEVLRARTNAARVPDDVIAAMREERKLRRLRRRIRIWSRVGLVR